MEYYFNIFIYGNVFNIDDFTNLNLFLMKILNEKFQDIKIVYFLSIYCPDTQLVETIKKIVDANSEWLCYFSLNKQDFILKNVEIPSDFMHIYALREHYKNSFKAVDGFEFVTFYNFQKNYNYDRLNSMIKLTKKECVDNAHICTYLTTDYDSNAGLLFPYYFVTMHTLTKFLKHMQNNEQFTKFLGHKFCGYLLTLYIDRQLNSEECYKYIKISSYDDNCDIFKKDIILDIVNILPYHILFPDKIKDAVKAIVNFARYFTPNQKSAIEIEYSKIENICEFLENIANSENELDEE